MIKEKQKTGFNARSLELYKSKEDFLKDFEQNPHVSPEDAAEFWDKHQPEKVEKKQGK